MSGHSRDVSCPVCGKVMAARGLGSHQRQRHGGPQGRLADMPAVARPVPVRRAAVATPTSVVAPRRVGFVLVAQEPRYEYAGWFELPVKLKRTAQGDYNVDVRITTGAYAGQVVWARGEDLRGEAAGQVIVFE